MWQPIVNSFGLIFDIVGALLIWRYGLPAEINRDGTIAIAIEGTDEAMKQKARWYDQRGFSRGE